jgi:hypothetical protein
MFVRWLIGLQDSLRICFLTCVFDLVVKFYVENNNIVELLAHSGLKPEEFYGIRYSDLSYNVLFLYITDLERIRDH